MSHIALYPRTDSALQMAVPGGEPPQELHLPLVTFGENLGGQNLDGVSRALAELAGSYTVITAQAMGHATFNPEGGANNPDQGGPYGQREPDTAYLITDSQQLEDLYNDAQDIATTQLALPVQNVPFVPRVTAAHNQSAAYLNFTGEVLFDRVGLAYRGQTHYFPLLGATVGEYSD